MERAPADGLSHDPDAMPERDAVSRPWSLAPAGATASAEELPSTPWPLVAARRPILTEEERARVERVAATLRLSRPARHARAYAATLARAGVHRRWMPGPTLWVEDHRGIELVTESVARGFEYRSLELAGDGDALLISRPHDEAFERYSRDVLGLGTPEVLRVRPVVGRERSLCAACLEEPDVLAALVVAARRAGGFNIVPFRSSGHAWRLARTIALAADVQVSLSAPVPPLARAANDKLWFADAARALLGDDALPPTWRVHGPAVAADRLARLAREHERLVLKTPSSAGALGNVVLEAAALRGRSLGEIRARVLAALAALGGYGRWPLLLGVWEEGVLASPSLQSWIPAPGHGEPVLEGVYEQRLVGESGTFVGAREATLPEGLARRLEGEGLQLALLLQRLGYVGRASFDALLVGPEPSVARLHWIECNARWGGVSIPMCVLRRLGVGPGERAVLIALVPLDAARVPFEVVLGASTASRYDRERRSGIVWLTPPDTGRRGLAFVAVGATAAAATALADDTVDRIAALNGP